MKFVDKIIDWFKFLGDLVADSFGKLFRFIEKPFSYLFSFLDGIFYFFTVFFAVVVKIIMIFVACFQFVFAIGAGILRTAYDLLTVNPTDNVSFPSESRQGFNVVIDLIKPIGLYDVVPMIMIALVWGGFALKMLGLFGGSIMVNIGGGDKK